MTATMEKLSTWEGIKAATKLVAQNTTTIRERVQAIGCAIVALGATGEQEARNAPAYALALAQSLGKGVNAKALVSFFALHSPIAINLQDGKASLRSATYKQGATKGQPNPHYRAWNPEGAADVMWFDCKEEKAADVPTYAAFIGKLDKLLKGALADKDGNPVEYATDDDRAKVEALVTALRTAQASMAGAEPETETEANPRQLRAAA
jgi:hypothetical protein